MRWTMDGAIRGFEPWPDTALYSWARHFIDFMYDEVTRPKGSDMGVVVTLKSKMVGSSASIGGNSKMVVLFDLSESSNESSEPLLEGPATSEHMSVLLPFRFPASGKYNAILDSFVTTTTTPHVRAAKALFDVITHKVYSNTTVPLSMRVYKWVAENSMLGISLR